MSLLLMQWPLLLVYLWYNSPYTLTLRSLPLTTLCHSSLVLPLVGVLFLVSLLMSLLSSIICFFRISYHSIWPISNFHTIPIKRCAFLYAFVTNAPMSFPTLFIRSLVEVHRSSAKSHGLFFPVFIHRILLDLDLEDFPTSEPIHIIAPIGATFLSKEQLN